MNFSNTKSIHGIALLCDTEGHVLSFLHDGFGVADILHKNDNWIHILDGVCRTKAAHFMDAVKETGATFDWELNVLLDQDVYSIAFAGLMQNEKMIILAAENKNDLSALIHEFTQINNEQANILRMVSKENFKLKERLDRDSKIYDDISLLNNELVNLQRSLAKKNIELEKLHKLKNQFIGIAAHDLRNPLGNIFLLAELLEMHNSNFTSDQIDNIEHIKKMSSFMLQLVEELLDVSVIEEGSISLNTRSFDLIELLNHCLKLNRPFATKKNINLAFQSSIKSLGVNMDQNKMMQVVNNLLTNAIKFSDEHSDISINLSEQQNEVVIQVADQGRGIHPHDIETIFSPFKKGRITSTAGEKSTGLGLYIVKRIIDAHKGTISVKSIVDKGSTFTITLPKTERNRE